MRKTCTLNARLTPLERASLELLAERDGLDLSKTLRTIIREKAVQNGIWDRAAQITQHRAIA
jgi:hypothetical protein